MIRKIWLSKVCLNTIKLQFLEYLPILQYLSDPILTSLLQFEVDQRIIGNALVVYIGLVIKQLSRMIRTWSIREVYLVTKIKTDVRHLYAFIEDQQLALEEVYAVERAACQKISCLLSTETEAKQDIVALHLLFFK